MATSCYDAHVITSIPSLEDAKARLSDFDLPSILNSFKTMAIAAQQEDNYGLTLIHRHTNVPHGYRLMDFGRTLQTWEIPDQVTTLHGATIIPKSLALREGVWKAYEFELGPGGQSNEAFLNTAAKLLQSYGCEEVLGLRRFSPSDPEELEITEKAGISIKIPRAWVNSCGDDTTETFWAFPDGGFRQYRCSCRDTGSSTNPNHNHIDGNKVYS
ncbi:Hypothetical protein D9617_70g089300 [Elsinoe fawcettii]|nr:Hypothetical protein D9617_70g089300 [Elsinoe fawcettii]